MDIWNMVEKLPESSSGIHTAFIDAAVNGSVMGKPIDNWLKEMKESARSRYLARFNEFLEWTGKTDVELVQEYRQATDKDAWTRKWGSIVLQYYQARLSAGYSVNSARADSVAPRSFFSSQCQEVKIQRGKIAKAQIATGEHSFTQDELKKMFHYGDVKQKAILATAVSLGWSSIDFLSLERSFIEPYVKKAREEKLEFVQFIYARQKTDETAICHLMPEAIESLDAYLKTTPRQANNKKKANKQKKQDAKFLWYSPSNYDEPLTNKALNDILKGMVKQASIMTTGDVKFNLLRKFTFSTLQRLGMTESESRVCVGKTVSPDVLTYLINLKDTLIAKYRKAYVGLTLVKSNGNGRIDNLQTAVNTVMDVLRSLVEDKLREKGMMKKTKPIDWQAIYQQLLPEEERPEKVPID
jgi:site-specific recombinase XerD